MRRDVSLHVWCLPDVLQVHNLPLLTFSPKILLRLSKNGNKILTMKYQLKMNYFLHSFLANNI